MIWVFIVAAILSAALSPAAPVQETEPPEEIRIGDVAEVAEIDPVKDANAEKGWYKKTKGGWMFWPEGTVDESKPPKAELAAFMNSELTESVIGLALLAFPVVLVIRWKARKRKRANEKDMKRVSGVSQSEFQAYMRKVNEIASVLHNVIPDSADAGRKNGGKRRWI